jgi:hypothetical protein
MPIHKLIRRWRMRTAVLLASLPALTHAGPMGFQDSWMTMGDIGPNWREVFINYALTSRDAIGISQTYMRADDDSKSRDFTEITYTRLLQRWNQRSAQANLWFVGGVGSIRLSEHGHERDNDRESGDESEQAAISPGIQADYETTRIYLSATYRLYRASGINHDYSAARAGFSFFEAEYEQTQPWLIVEARSMHDLSDQLEVTPMLRLINKNYFVEAGVNNFSQPRFNFMYIF